jgi:hypothetical protein
MFTMKVYDYAFKFINEDDGWQVLAGCASEVVWMQRIPLYFIWVLLMSNGCREMTGVLLCTHK